MSMSLMPSDLRQIAAQIEKIIELEVSVESFRVGAHKVMLRWEGPDGPVVVGITEGEWATALKPAPQPALKPTKRAGAPIQQGLHGAGIVQGGQGVF